MNLQAFCHTDKSFSNLDPQHQDLVASISTQFDMAATFAPYEHKQVLWKAMARKLVQVPSEIFENLQKEDSLEMWAKRGPELVDMRFVLAMGSILRLTSYPFEQLATVPWHNLFTRDQENSMKILFATQKALETQETQYDVTDWHEVQETMSPKKLRLQVAVTQITPYRGPNNEGGVFALVKSKPTFDV